MDKVLKNHIIYGTGIVILGFFTLLLCFIFLVVLAGAYEALSRGDMYYFGGYSMMSGMWGIVAILVGLWLRQTIRDWLSYRIPKVPEVCIECKKKLHPYEVKWNEQYTKAECPHCGISLKVTKEWD